MDQFKATVVADSYSPETGKQLTTLQLTYPRFVHPEFMTHRVFSRNASSSRAIPVAKVIDQVRNNPAMPVHWGKNQPGMQAHEELEDTTEAVQSWKRAARQAADVAEHMNMIGLHKQVTNRILEPFQLIHVVVSATEWDNFFALRDHKDAQPEIQTLARLMKEAMDESSYIVRSAMRSENEQWHLPYVTEEERALYRLDVLIKCSAARCARVSYMKHDGTNPSPTEDVALYDRLVGADPIHASPVEHQARNTGSNVAFGNFWAWRQHRQDVEALIRNRTK